MGKAGVLKLTAALGLAFGVSACAAPPAAAPAPQPPPQAAPSTPPAPPPPAPAFPRPAADACGAAALKFLVGRPRTEIPIPLEPGRRRVLCTTCPIERDYAPRRQTILYDERSGLVTSVACG